MTADHQTLEDVARLIAPAGSEVSHLCVAGAGTFSIDVPGVDGIEGAYALKVVEEPHRDAARSAAEFSALLAIDHPHVVRYRDTGTHQHAGSEYRWLAMDFVDGWSVAQLLSDGTAIDRSTAVRLLRGAVSGAAALWDAGTTHRDLAADNVIITSSGDVVIVDLGLAEEDGTERPGGWQADQFALGLLGYYLTTGEQYLGQGDHQARPSDRHPFDRLAHTVAPAVSPDLARVLATMLAPQPRDRYTDPLVLQADLAKIADAEGAADTPLPVPPHGQVCRRT